MLQRRKYKRAGEAASFGGIEKKQRKKKNKGKKTKEKKQRKKNKESG
jgi:hypothetical protein